MYTIRAITRHEHVWITTETLHALFSQLTQSTLLSEKQFRHWFDETNANPCFTLFGVMASPEKYPKLIGIGTLWTQPKYYRNNGKNGHIEDIVIDKAHQKKGLGEQLVKFIIDYAKNHGCYKVQLHCSEEMIPFYKKVGLQNTSKSMTCYF